MTHRPRTFVVIPARNEQARLPFTLSEVESYLCREKIDSETLSNTDSPSNRLTIWKLRAIPALIRSLTVAKVMSFPSNRI